MQAHGLRRARFADSVSGNDFLISLTSAGSHVSPTCLMFQRCQSLHPKRLAVCKAGHFAGLGGWCYSCAMKIENISISVSVFVKIFCLFQWFCRIRKPSLLQFPGSELLNAVQLAATALGWKSVNADTRLVRPSQIFLRFSDRFREVGCWQC